MTGSNVINVLKGSSGAPFCVITQHRKVEFGHHHHRQSKKISNAQELTMQLSQTLSSAIAQIQKMHKKTGENFVDLPAIRRPMTEGSSS